MFQGFEVTLMPATSDQEPTSLLGEAQEEEGEIL
jgi:hypothetical protein